MSYINAIGLVAGALTTVSLLPQLIKTRSTRSTKDLSLAWLIIVEIGTALWFLYGIVLSAPPLLIWNSISFVLLAFLIAFKLKYR